jgi:hypothetical protein
MSHKEQYPCANQQNIANYGIYSFYGVNLPVRSSVGDILSNKKKFTATPTLTPILVLDRV